MAFLKGNIRKKSRYATQRQRGLRPGVNSYKPIVKKKRLMSPKDAKKKAIEQVLAFYKPGWPGLAENERASRTAIAQALVRRGLSHPTECLAQF